MRPELRAIAETVPGFMPPDEGIALHDAAVAAARRVPDAPIVEIGSWCGRSTVYLGAAAREAGTVVLAVDHHRGSEELQAGWPDHDPSVVDVSTGLIDTLPHLRATIHDAGLEDVVVVVVADSPTFASVVSVRAAMVFVDGGHGAVPAHADFDAWSPSVAPGGVLAVHDVFPDPADGGRPPYEIYLRALTDGFVEESSCGSLRVLRRP